MITTSGKANLKFSPKVNPNVVTVTFHYERGNGSLSLQCIGVPRVVTPIITNVSGKTSLTENAYGTLRPKLSPTNVQGNSKLEFSPKAPIVLRRFLSGNSSVKFAASGELGQIHQYRSKGITNLSFSARALPIVIKRVSGKVMQSFTASAIPLVQVSISGKSSLAFNTQVKARVVTPISVSIKGKTQTYFTTHAIPSVRNNTIWDDFNKGMLIGLQISDKAMLGYNVGDQIKLKNLEYNAETNFWLVLR